MATRAAGWQTEVNGHPEVLACKVVFGVLESSAFAIVLAAAANLAVFGAKLFAPYRDALFQAETVTVGSAETAQLQFDLWTQEAIHFVVID